MKRFLKFVLLFSLPILLLCGTLELLIRYIPNDYRYKKEYLDHHSDQIQVLCLGSSYAYYGINPDYINSNGFNAGYISQSINYDYEILKKYQDHWSHLEYIAIPVSYSSLFGNLESSVEAWRVKNYNIYYDLNISHKPENYSEFLSNNLTVNIKRIYWYYVLGRSNITCSNLGWGTDYTSKCKNDLRETGRIAAKRNAKKNDAYFAENVSALRAIIAFAKQKSVKLILYTPPAYKSYVEHLNKAQLNQTITTLQQIDKEYACVTYHNFLSDSSFTSKDFYDADHLNEIGAKKFTQILNSLIMFESHNNRNTKK